jgi:hypothetical protein
LSERITKISGYAVSAFPLFAFRFFIRVHLCSSVVKEFVKISVIRVKAFALSHPAVSAFSLFRFPLLLRVPPHSKKMTQNPSSRT